MGTGIGFEIRDERLLGHVWRGKRMVHDELGVLLRTGPAVGMVVAHLLPVGVTDTTGWERREPSFVGAMRAVGTVRGTRMGRIAIGIAIRRRMRTVVEFFPLGDDGGGVHSFGWHRVCEEEVGPFGGGHDVVWMCLFDGFPLGFVDSHDWWEGWDESFWWCWWRFVVGVGLCGGVSCAGCSGERECDAEGGETLELHVVVVDDDVQVNGWTIGGSVVLWIDLEGGKLRCEEF